MYDEYIRMHVHVYIGTNLGSKLFIVCADCKELLVCPRFVKSRVFVL